MPQPPTNGGVTSPFGMRINPNDGTYRTHYGEDTIGAGNYAPATGRVVYAGYDKTGAGLGWCVGIREIADPSVIWWVAHHGTSALFNPLKVKVDYPVSQGVTYLGPKGSTGASKGPHAHTERRVGGVARPGSGTATNPRNFYRGGSGGGGFTHKGETMDIIQLDYLPDKPAFGFVAGMWVKHFDGAAQALAAITSTGKPAVLVDAAGFQNAIYNYGFDTISPQWFIDEAKAHPGFHRYSPLMPAATGGTDLAPLLTEIRALSESVAAIKFPTKVTLPEGTLS